VCVEESNDAPCVLRGGLVVAGAGGSGHRDKQLGHLAGRVVVEEAVPGVRMLLDVVARSIPPPDAWSSSPSGSRLGASRDARIVADCRSWRAARARVWMVGSVGQDRGHAFEADFHHLPAEPGVEGSPASKRTGTVMPSIFLPSRQVAPGADLVVAVCVARTVTGRARSPVSSSGTWAKVALSNISMMHIDTGSNGCSNACVPLLVVADLASIGERDVVPTVRAAALRAPVPRRSRPRRVGRSSGPSR
jgi:hypothetical protein